jgi:hypothetical protein
MFIAALLLSTSSAVDCEAFVRQLDTPVAISARPITASQLAGSAVKPLPSQRGARSGSRIGELVYRGYGVELRSKDPRFKSIRVRNSSSFAHDCGHAVRAPGGWNAFDEKLATWTLGFDKRPNQHGPPPGAIEAASKGARPVLKGARVGPTFPVGSGSRSFFLGVMYPEGKRNESLIVAFADRPQATPARVLARLRMHVQFLGVLPALHSSETYVDVYERTADGALRHVVLELDRPTRDRIAHELNR